MSVIRVEEITKTYGEKVLFDQISFTIEEKQRIGLIGVNGTGKSSLLRVLAGLDSKEAGEIVHANQFHIEFLRQDPDFDEELTVIEHIYYGDSPIMSMLRSYDQIVSELEQHPEDPSIQQQFMKIQERMDAADAWDAMTKAKTVLTRLGITQFQQPVRTLSGGQRKRVALAKTLIQPADLLILDEPTNHLDHEMIEWLETFLPQLQQAMLIVTHDRYFLNRVTNRILELDQGKLYSYDGNYEYFLAKKAEREEREQASELKRQNLLRRELAWLSRGARARSTKQKARIERAEALQESKPSQQGGAIDVSLGAKRLGKKVLEAKGIDFSRDSSVILRDFNALIVPGERLGIIGPNGSGKSTLLNILAGRIQPDQGNVETGPTVQIGYYTQDHQDMDEQLRVIEYIREIAETIHTVDGQVITAEQMLERFLFSRNSQWTRIHRLSGGERRRLYLLGVLMSEPNVLFLDEPTNDLDTQTLSVLEDYLEQFPGVVITVSHDRFFLDQVVDHLLIFEGEGVISSFGGGYSEYLEMRKKSRAESVRLENEREKKEAEPRGTSRKKLSYKEQQEWNGIEDKITALEQRVEALQNEIVEAGSNSEKVQQLFQEQQETEALLEQAIERWTELSERLSGE